MRAVLFFLFCLAASTMAKKPMKLSKKIRGQGQSQGSKKFRSFEKIVVQHVLDELQAIKTSLDSGKAWPVSYSKCQSEVAGLKQQVANTVKALGEMKKKLDVLSAELAEMHIVKTSQNTCKPGNHAKQQNGTLLALEARVEALEKQSEDNEERGERREARVPHVEFSSIVSVTHMNMTRNEAVIFGYSLTNIGEAYNPETGVFTCPVRGTYHFYVAILSEYRSYIETQMVVNGDTRMSIYAGSNYHGSGSNYVILNLASGDRVWVRVHEMYGKKPLIVKAWWSTFSGFLFRV